MIADLSPRHGAVEVLNVLEKSETKESMAQEERNDASALEEYICRISLRF